MINGIQQVGIGTPNVHDSFKWYRRNFGFDVPVFNEAAEAPLMAQYTGDKVQSRHAILAMNLHGGGGMEIWQYTSRVPAAQPTFSLRRTGLLVTRIKCENAASAQAGMKSGTVSAVVKDPVGKAAFSVVDPYGNPFIVAESDSWYKKEKGACGGIEGIVIGVSDMEKALRFYREVLEIDKVVSDETRVFEDFAELSDGHETYRRVRLMPSNRHSGAFSKVFGDFFLELIQVTSASNLDHNLKGRYWGDQGYIHLCFDVNQMDAIKDRASALNNPFTVDTGNSFSMGEAAGRFAYVEDPDGTLIELVETDKITISKKLGWRMTLSQSRKRKPLPDFLFSVIGMTRVKD
jgi:catechol 2,3-dioxygenase-like lactoylglutathione lyase family enzyme